LVAEQILEYMNGISEGMPSLPRGVSLLLPYQDAEVQKILEAFYYKFYADTRPRCLILGINPGRFGAGITGIPFTDSKRLKNDCGIDTPLDSYETSSEFVYKVVERYGGATAFYGDFLINSISPVGFVKDGKNFNYYDDKTFMKRLEPYIAAQMAHLLKLPINCREVICFGEGKNYQALHAFNQRHGWFGNIRPLAHPRYIMQYKRKQIDFYLDQYMIELANVKAH